MKFFVREPAYLQSSTSARHLAWNIQHTLTIVVYAHVPLERESLSVGQSPANDRCTQLYTWGVSCSLALRTQRRCLIFRYWNADWKWCNMRNYESAQRNGTIEQNKGRKCWNESDRWKERAPREDLAGMTNGIKGIEEQKFIIHNMYKSKNRKKKFYQLAIMQKQVLYFLLLLIFETKRITFFFNCKDSSRLPYTFRFSHFRVV